MSYLFNDDKSKAEIVRVIEAPQSVSVSGDLYVAAKRVELSGSYGISADKLDDIVVLDAWISIEENNKSRLWMNYIDNDAHLTRPSIKIQRIDNTGEIYLYLSGAVIDTSVTPTTENTKIGCDLLIL